MRIFYNKYKVKRILKSRIWWQFYDKSGFRLIYEKLIPPEESKIKKKPSSLLLWIFGIYFTFYGITVTRYENRVNRIENYTNLVVSQLSSTNYKNVFFLISRVQNTKCPFEPNIMEPMSIIYSWMGTKDCLNNDVVERLKRILESWSDSLSQVNLSYVHLENANLEHANLNNTILDNAHLENVALWRANLMAAFLKNIHLENADLTFTNCKFAYLENAHLDSANLWSTNLIGANLTNADLKNIKLDSPYSEKEEQKYNLISFIKELEKAREVKGIKLDDKFIKIIKSEFPELYKRIYPCSVNK